MSLDGKDAGTMHIEELCNSIIRFYTDTQTGWGFNSTHKRSIPEGRKQSARDTAS
jgi:hypothetical protein